MSIAVSRLKKSAVAVLVAAAAVSGLTALPAHADSVSSNYMSVTGLGSLSQGGPGSQISQSTVINRAQDWYAAGVPYSTNGLNSPYNWWYDSQVGGRYREDCSGFVSMAWGLTSSLTTDSLDNRSITTRVSTSDLQPGDALDDTTQGHVILFDHWVDQAAGEFMFYQESERGTNMLHETDYIDGGSDGLIAGHPAGSYFGLRYNNITAAAVPPKASLTAPAAGAVVRGTVTLSASASDSAGTVESVQFQVDGVDVGTVTSAPYNLPWNTATVTPGPHQITAIPHNTAGQWGQASPAQTVNVAHNSHDVNGDGKDDVLAVSAATGDLYLYTGTGTGVSGGTVINTGWGGMSQVTQGDFTGDGIPDIVAVNASNGNLYLYVGNGNGTYQAPTVIGTGWGGMTHIAAGDFTGDGKADILAINGSNNNLYLYKGTGTGIDGGTVISTGWGQMRELAVGDFNGDGKADVMAINASNNDLYLYKSNGSGVDAGTVIGTGFGQITKLVSADINGDGKADLLGVNTSDTNLYLFTSNGSNGISSTTSINNGWTGMSHLL